MRRREFLKLVGLASVAATVPLPVLVANVAGLPRMVTLDGLGYRSAGKGRIEVSADGGKTWKLHSDLGSGYLVRRLSVDSANHLKAIVAFQRWTFGLQLGADRRSWLTT